MRRIQIYMDEWLDDALAVEAASRGTSKAALIRQWVSERLEPASEDPISAIVGAVDCEPAAVDDVVYGG